MPVTASRWGCLVSIAVARHILTIMRWPALLLILNGVLAAADPVAPPGMVWIPAGEFAMGSEQPDTNENERPVHGVRVSGFFMDRTEVTNAQFAAFVQATGYKTTAEKPVDWEELKKQVPPGTPKPDDGVLAPGALVFIAPPKPLDDLTDYSQWW